MRKWLLALTIKYDWKGKWNIVEEIDMVLKDFDKSIR
jgi:hypothetical protein